LHERGDKGGAEKDSEEEENLKPLIENYDDRPIRSIYT
jgi:hypothetical protein